MTPLNEFDTTFKKMDLNRDSSNSYSKALKYEFMALLSFLKKPFRHRYASQERQLRWQRFITLLGTTIGFSLIFSSTFGIVIKQFADADYLPNVTFSFLVLVGLITAPLLEELVFRAGLRSPTYTLFIGPILICLVIVLNWQFVLVFALLAGIFALCWHSPDLFQKHEKGFNLAIHRGRQFINNYPKVFYLYAVAFAFIHLVNFSINTGSGFFIIFLLIPQLISGLCMAYIRLRDGLGYAITLHSAHNLITYGISHLLQMVGT